MRFWYAKSCQCTNSFSWKLVYYITHRITILRDGGNVIQILHDESFFLKIYITVIGFILHAYYLRIRTVQRSRRIHGLIFVTLLSLDSLIAAALTCLHCCEGHWKISRITQCSHNFLKHLPLELKCFMFGFCIKSKVPAVSLKSWEN